MLACPVLHVKLDANLFLFSVAENIATMHQSQKVMVRMIANINSVLVDCFSGKKEKYHGDPKSDDDCDGSEGSSSHPKKKQA